MSHDAFISYASEDRAVALEVCSALEGAGLTCWIAPRDILPAQDYGGAITEAIQESRVVVLLISEGSNRSPQVRREIAQAAGRDLAVVPYRIHDVELSPSLRYYLSGTQWLDALPAAGPRRYDALIAAVRKVAGAPAPAAAGAPEITPSQQAGPVDTWRRKLLRPPFAMAALFAAVLVAVLGLWGIPKLRSSRPPDKVEVPAAPEAVTKREEPAPRALRFKPGCPLPFADIAVEREISYRCGVSGGDRDPAGIVSNLAKNNFCAGAPARALTFWDFKSLQARVESAQIPFGSQKIATGTTSRAGFEAIGEGRLVRLVGFLRYPHSAGPETVNCSEKGAENNDLHVSLSAQRGDDLCESVLAEISPHFRPDAWRQDVLGSLERIVRVSGQLFFDDAHLPCRGGKPSVGHPARASVWEIHPVYALDVCRGETLAACPAQQESAWVPLRQWIGRR